MPSVTRQEDFEALKFEQAALEKIRSMQQSLLRIEASVFRLGLRHGLLPSPDLRVRNDPPSWTGSSMAGRRYSECPAVYLEKLAQVLRQASTKARREGKTKAANAATLRAITAQEWAWWAHREDPPPIAPGKGVWAPRK